MNRAAHRRPSPLAGRVRVGAVAGLLLVTGLGTAATPAAAASEPCWSGVITDLDGGGPDVAVGLPSFDLPGKPDAGAIVVYSNVGTAGEADPKAPTARTLITADDIDGLSSQAEARFGSSLFVWRDAGTSDDDDLCADLLVGVPGQDVAGQAEAGQVVMLRGTPDGLDGVRLTLDEATLDGTGGAQAGAHFGQTVVAETLGMIAVGAPGRDVGSAADAGRVVRLDYETDLVAPVVRVDEQGGANPGAAETGDRFGEVLSIVPTGLGPLVLVGIPHEDIGSKVDAGAVGLLPAHDRLSMVSQDSAGAAGAAERGDLYGSSLATWATFTTHPVVMVAVGVPGEDFGGLTNPGMVSFASVDLVFDPVEEVGAIAGRGESLSQNSPGVPGSAEAGDRFGTALLAGELGRESLHLLATSRTEDVGAVGDAGMVGMTRINPDLTLAPGGPQPGAWTQDSPGESGTAERSDLFGSAVSSVLLTRLEDDDDTVWALALVTVPGEDLGSAADAGMAYLGYPPGGAGSVSLVPPVIQAGAGLGMAPMQIE